MEPLYVLRARRRVGEADEMESGCRDGRWRNGKCRHCCFPFPFPFGVKSFVRVVFLAVSFKEDKL
jgi:hypothetical protein